MVVTVLGAGCSDPAPCGPSTPLPKESVTKAPGVYDGFEVTPVADDRTVQVVGKGSQRFSGSRVECRVSSWSYGVDGGAPTFTDQDARCNFEAKLYWRLATSEIHLGVDCEYGFENGVRVERWEEMDRAIEIVGAELRSSDLGETYVVGRQVLYCL
ncbi:MAG: hypothetical protein QM765_26405 [Myxococcales bacterium]